MARSPKPRFFVSRPDNTITPLIALDELPSSIRLTGVPTIMSAAETTGMMSLGVEERSSGRYMIDMTERSSTPNSEKPWTHVSSQQQVGLLKVPHEGMNEGIKKAENETPAECKEKKTQGLPSIDNTQAAIDAMVLAKSSVAEEAPAASGRDSLTRGKKVYCTHWIRRGECDFLQQGCLYKHEMPDVETLKAIGIRGIPTWYLKAHPERAQKYSLENAVATPAGDQQHLQTGEKQFTPQPPLWRSPSLSVSRPALQTSSISMNRPYTGFAGARSGHLHGPQQYLHSRNASNIPAEADDRSPLDKEIISSRRRELSHSHAASRDNSALATTEAISHGTAVKIATPTPEPCAPPYPNTAQLNRHKAAIDAAYSPLNPSPRVDQEATASPISGLRKSSVSLDTLTLAPKGPALVYRRRFAPPGEELFVTIPEEAQSVQEKAVVEDGPAWRLTGTDHRGGRGRGRGRGFQNSRGTGRRRGAVEDLLLDL
ncbi:MAG: hypothetical protein Q9167_006765 [Letrouitia subvulpina]